MARRAQKAGKAPSDREDGSDQEGMKQPEDPVVRRMPGRKVSADARRKSGGPLNYQGVPDCSQDKKRQKKVEQPVSY